MQHKSIQLTDLRVGTKSGLEEGQFVGYASVFGNVDLHGDITAKGAFTASLDTWSASSSNIPVLYGHRTDDPDYNVGHVISATEDDRGLLVTAQLDLDSPKGAQVYRLLKGRRLSEMSFAYEVQDSARVKTADGKSANELRKLKLHEVSLVPQGANPATEIVAVKAAPDLSTETLALRLRIADLNEGNNMTVKASRQGNMREKRAAVVADIAAIRTKAVGDETTGVGFTDEQKTELHALIDELDTIDAKIEKAGEGAKILDALDRIAGSKSLGKLNAMTGKHEAPQAATANRGYFDVSAKSFAGLGERLIKGMLTENSHGQKALLPAGETAVSVSVSPNIVTDARPLSELLAAIPVVKQSSPVFRFLRQTARTNAAAIVDPGDLKPTSLYGLTPVEGELKVIAHLSEGIDKYSLQDVANLERFVTDEMTYGLHRALENQILNGAGVVAGPPAKNELTGLLNTSGIQSQAFVTDLLTTTRKAVTAVESLGHTAGTFVLSPVDWEALELARTDTAGSLELGGPVDRAKRTLWGVNIAICTALPAKTAVLIDPTALAVDTDGQVEIKWDGSGDNFDHNLMKARVESRYHLSVYQPLGVVKIATAA